MSQFLDDMLFGASVSAPLQGDAYVAYDSDELQACVLGAIAIARFFAMHGHLPNTRDERDDTNQLAMAAFGEDARYQYRRYYGTGMINDNDTHGRDFVIQRFKEMETDGGE